MTNPGADLLRHLVSRGDAVSVTSGRLLISPASGYPVPDGWLRKHGDCILGLIARYMRGPTYRFTGYKAGKFGGGRIAGVCLQFEEVITGREAYAIFNASITRARTTRHGKAGAPLPAGQFRVGPRSGFLKFWRRAGLEEPPRLTSFHDYMGKLRPLLFQASVADGERLDKSTIKPLEVSADGVASIAGGLKLPDNHRTSAGQLPDNIQTSLPDKVLLEGQQPCGFPVNSTAGDSNRGNTIKGITGTRSSYPQNVVPMPSPPKFPAIQVDEEWWASYDSDEKEKHT